MDQQLTPEQLAAQLRKPEGELGIEVAQTLNGNNFHCTLLAYEKMELKAGDRVLEIGFGNGKLMPEMFSFTRDLKITGVDFSETMVDEARKHLKSYIDQGKIDVLRAEVSSLPFEDNTFDKIGTVNTLYFWPKPIDDAREVLRVLKPGGLFQMGIRPKVEVEKLEATKFGFTLYDPDRAVALLEEAGFVDCSYTAKADPAIVFEGREYQMTSICVSGKKSVK